MARTSIWWCLPLVVLACGTGERPQALDTRSDDSALILDIAGTAASGDLVFESASGATRLSDGTVVIGDDLASVVRFFDSSGRQVHAAGREGEGPGEFSDIAWLGQCGTDSVFVWDNRLLRMTLFDATGSVAEMYRLPNDPSAAPAGFIGCSRHGVFAFIAIPQGMVSISERYSAGLFLADQRGAVTRTFGEVPAYEGSPLGRVTSIAVSDDYVYMGTKDSAFVDVYSLSGERVTVLPVGVAPRPATTQHFERAIDRIVVGLGSVADRDMLRELLLQRAMPEYLPPYGNLFTDPEGTLWVQISIPGDPETWLRAIGQDGGVIADVHLPLELNVFEVGRDYVLGAYEDESGEPHVAVYRLRRG